MIYGLNEGMNTISFYFIESIVIIMEEIAALKYILKKSRFFAHLYSIEETQDLDSILKQHRKLYKKACHHCYGVKFQGVCCQCPMESYKNDGEVGRPGKLLLELLKKYELNNHVLVVSRIFGGVKLGPAGITITQYTPIQMFWAAQGAAQANTVTLYYEWA